MEPKVVTVFKMFDKTLVGKLPVDQPEFMALIDRENIISEEVKKRMNSTNRSKDIRADVIVGEIEKSLPDREKIDKLFVVMKEYNHGLEKLAQEIENHLDPCMYISVHTQVMYVRMYIQMYIWEKLGYVVTLNIMYVSVKPHHK